jgi:hypothetical protein
VATRALYPPVEEEAPLPLPSSHARRLGPARLLRKTGVGNSILVGWSLWALFSLSLFIQSGSNQALLISYFLYLILGAVGLWGARKDILAPTGVFVLVAFSGFGLNIPLIATGHVPFIRIDDDTLTKVMIIVLFAHIGFMCGSLLPNTYFNPIRKIVGTRNSTRGTSLVAFFALLSLEIVAGIVRMELHLGEAGVQPTIPYAGIFQFVLYHGLLMLCVWYLVQGLTQKRIHTILGLAITQALLGWRGGILSMLIIAVVSFWYQFKLHDNQKYYSMAWLIILLFLSYPVIQLGNAIRSERLGGESSYAKSNEEFAMNILTRSQGTTRLAEVVKHFGPLSFTNDFLIEKLLSKGLTTTKYIDKVVYGIVETRSHSVGTSGLGGPYTALGISGVLVSYFLIGMLYRLSYFATTNYTESGTNVFGIVWYAFLILMLFEIVNENLSVNTLKMYFAVLAQLYFFKFLFRAPNPR